MVSFCPIAEEEIPMAAKQEKGEKCGNILWQER